MSLAPDPQPSFSARRRFHCAFHAVAGVLAVTALVVMANYLANRHAARWFLSSQSELRLSPQTLGFLRTLTNQVTVTVFYDREEPFFSTVTGLLKEYHLANPRITVRVVDYLRDGGAAQQVYADYQLTGATNKNLILFDCEGRVKRVEGNLLVQFALEPVRGSTEREFLRKPVAFHGEKAFTLALLAVTNPKPLQARFLTGHDEHVADSADDVQGYLKFSSLLVQSYIQVGPLSLAGTNSVPEDCNLLIVAGPLRPLPAAELEKIGNYLNQGGRLLALFNSFATPRACGLEVVLSRWGVDVNPNVVVDPASSTVSGYDLKTANFAAHPAVDPLVGSALHLIRPRAVARRDALLQAADAPAVEEIVRSASTARLANEMTAAARSLPLIVAVEQGAVRGVVTERGTTRMVIAGDSMFLANQMIESGGNRDFAIAAVNWLLDRAQLLHGLGPRPVAEFRLSPSRAELETLQWLLLAALPGAVLLLGGLVWLRRRS
jgi:hypothetical protein